VLEHLAEVPLPVLAAASALDHFQAPRGDPWASQVGWRLGRVDQPAAWTRAGVEHRASVSADLSGASLVVTSEAAEVTVRLARSATGRHTLLVDRDTVHVWDHGDIRVVEWRTRSYRLRRTGLLTIEANASGASGLGEAGQLTAPMPGRVVRVAVADGQHVVANQPLVVLEAMKMEHVVEAPHAGVVTELCVHEGERVAAGARLLTLAP
jgi:3-methylcrotonyl-CoA carboxylase alpha subunit